MFRILFFAVLVLSSFLCHGQSDASLSKGQTKLYNKALKCLKKGKKQEGIMKLEELIRSKPTFTKGREKLVSLYWKEGDLENTIVHLKALNNTFPENDKYRYNLIKAYEENGDLVNALAVLKMSGETMKEADMKRIKELEFRINALDNPVEFDPKKLQGSINTTQMEYHPILSADGSTMYYVTVEGGRFRNEDIYSSSVSDSLFQFGTGQNLPNINSRAQEGAFTISQDGRIMIFTGCDKTDAIGGCDLYLSIHSEGQWGPPRNLGDKINSRYWDAAPSLGSDGRTLFFASKRPGGQGGSDIWVSRLEGRTWSDPENLGEVINTPENDEVPFIHPDMTTLYFVSEGHVGMGSYDIFMSKKEGSSWTTPKNLGYPINTEHREGGLSIDLFGERAYFSSMIDFGMKNDTMVTGDIYYFDLPVESRPDPTTYVVFHVLDKDSGAPIESTVEIEGLRNEYSNRLRSHSEGSLVTMTKGMYSINVNTTGYSLYSENINFDSPASMTEPLLYTIELIPIKTIEKESEPIVLQNIFFESGSADLLDISMGEIKQLEKLLRENPNVSVKIIGHTDNVGKDADNLVLSRDRAKAVYNKLVELGIPSSRLAYEGKGESVPLADNESEEGRQKNRRTEFIILK